MSPAPIIHGWPNPPMRPVVPFENHGKFEAPEPFTLQENMLVMIAWDPPTMLFAMFVSYATYGPVTWVVRKLRRPRLTG